MTNRSPGWWRWGAGAGTRCTEKRPARWNRTLRIATQALLVALTVFPAWAGHCPGIDYADQETSVWRLRQLYLGEEFTELEAAFGCLLGDAGSFTTGKPASSAVYQTFRSVLKGSTVSTGDSARVERWRKAMPQSIFSEFAAIRLQYALAWNTRGSAPASRVPDEAMSSFHQRLLATEAALYDATPALRASVMWYQMLLAVAGDTRTRRSDMPTVFREAVQRWPAYYDFHEVLLTRMVPRWGGSWELVDAAIVRWAEPLGGAEADALYARLYASAVLAFQDDPHQTRLDWPRMKRGLQALVARYPDPAHKVVAVSFACAYGDAAFLKSSYQAMAGAQRPAAWLSGTNPIVCAPR